MLKVAVKLQVLQPSVPRTAPLLRIADKILIGNDAEVARFEAAPLAEVSTLSLMRDRSI